MTEHDNRPVPRTPTPEQLDLLGVAVIIITASAYTYALVVVAAYVVL